MRNGTYFFHGLIILVLGLLATPTVADEANNLPRSTPEAQAVSSEGVLRFVRAVDEHVDSLHSVMLLRKGHVIAEGWWSPYTAKDPHVLYSLSKSFTSTAVGIAIDEGRLSLDDPVIKFFPDRLPDKPSNNLQSMRVRDLLSMSTGQEGLDIGPIDFSSDESVVKQFLAAKVTHKPGTHFVYNTPASYMCAAIVQQVSGQPLLDYLTPRLFQPLGIENSTWSESKEGVAYGGFGLNLRTEDIARFGQMLLQAGEWNGRRIVSADWVAAATARQTSNGSNPASDWDQGYGYQFWQCRHDAYRGDGAFGQYCVVIPQHDLVLVMTGGLGDMQRVLTLAWENLLPALHSVALPENAQTQKQLSEMLTSLQLRRPESSEVGDEMKRKISGHTYQLEENELGLTSVRFDFTAGQTKVTFRDTTADYPLVSRADRWMRVRLPGLGQLDPRTAIALPQNTTVGVSAATGWTSADTMQLRLAMFETPFCQDFEFQFKDDAVVIKSEFNVWFGARKRPQLEGSFKTH